MGPDAAWKDARVFGVLHARDPEDFLKRMRCTAYYKELTPKNYFITDTDLPEEYDRVVSKALG